MAFDYIDVNYYCKTGTVPDPDLAMRDSGAPRMAQRHVLHADSPPVDPVKTWRNTEASMMGFVASYPPQLGHGIHHQCDLADVSHWLAFS